MFIIFPRVTIHRWVVAEGVSAGVSAKDREPHSGGEVTSPGLISGLQGGRSIRRKTRCPPRSPWTLSLGLVCLHGRLWMYCPCMLSQNNWGSVCQYNQDGFGSPQKHKYTISRKEKRPITKTRRDYKLWESIMTVNWSAEDGWFCSQMWTIKADPRKGGKQG